MYNDNGERDSGAQILKTTLLLNAKVMGLTLGILGGLAVFIMTNWLLIKGGENVGQHLELLSQFYIGYRVTFTGSLIGSLYGFLTGFFCGALIAVIYNMVVYLTSKNRN